MAGFSKTFFILPILSCHLCFGICTSEDGMRREVKASAKTLQKQFYQLQYRKQKSGTEIAACIIRNFEVL